ncbi:protein of unknown function [Methylorubrum extorquens DM4]|uniref:Uncharacterized protein n=1 Tax=Methylorubrum extorquens (strain DSM 6343 / CIP 106787 / DM4) TaxID=661410 RepID=C7C7N7_METED|nr:protein of unknown function [Methylorubrum extorquens DM4]
MAEHPNSVVWDLQKGFPRRDALSVNIDFTAPCSSRGEGAVLARGYAVLNPSDREPIKEAAFDRRIMSDGAIHQPDNAVIVVGGQLHQMVAVCSQKLTLRCHRVHRNPSFSGSRG